MYTKNIKFIPKYICNQIYQSSLNFIEQKHLLLCGLFLLCIGLKYLLDIFA